MSPIKGGPSGLKGTIPYTSQQSIAMAHPCKTPDERGHQRYIQSNHVRLTFDLFGYPGQIDGVCWHASVDEQVYQTHSNALYALYQALDGVGVGKTHQALGRGILRARRAATLSEQGASARSTEARR